MPDGEGGRISKRMADELDALRERVAVSHPRNSGRHQSLLERLSGPGERSAPEASCDRSGVARGIGRLHGLAVAFGKFARMGRTGKRVRAICRHRSGALFRLRIRGECRPAWLGAEARRHRFFRRAESRQPDRWHPAFGRVQSDISARRYGISGKLRFASMRAAGRESDRHRERIQHGGRYRADREAAPLAKDTERR